MFTVKLGTGKTFEATAAEEAYGAVYGGSPRLTLRLEASPAPPRPRLVFGPAGGRRGFGYGSSSGRGQRLPGSPGVHPGGGADPAPAAHRGQAPVPGAVQACGPNRGGSLRCPGPAMPWIPSPNTQRRCLLCWTATLPAPAAPSTP